MLFQHDTPINRLLNLAVMGVAGGGLSEVEVIGNPVAFNTNLARPLSGFTIPFLPVQDLHGYDSPWPAGGGKNKANMDDVQIGIAWNGGQNSERATVFINALPSTTYTVSVTGTDGLTSITYAEKTDATSTVNLYLSTFVNIITRTTTASTGCIAIQFAKTGGISAADLANVKVQLELGSTATSYSPYSNICPISGWQGLTAWRTGANVWDEEWELGTFNSQGQPSVSNTSIRCKNFIPVVPGQTYKYINGTGSSQAPWLYDINKEFISRYGSYMANGATITIPDGVYYIKFALPGTYGDTYKNDVAWNYPSTDTEYHPYAGDSYPVTFPDGQTIYGGTLDAVTGVLTVDTEFVSFRWGDVNGISVGDYTRKMATGRMSNYPNHKYTPVCNVAKYKTSYSEDSLHFYVNSAVSNNVIVFLPNDADGDTIVQVAYPLATPIEIPLEPITVQTLIGDNTIWTDTNGENTVKYKKKG